MARSLGMGVGITSYADAMNFPNNYSLDFDGTDDYITLGSTLTLGSSSDEFSASAWIRTSMSSGYGRIIGGASGGIFEYCGIYNGTTAWYGGSVAMTGGDVDDDTWHHIVYTYNNGTRKIYLDGSLDEGPDSTDSRAGNIAYIGVQQNGTEEFDGKIDEVAVWDVALDAKAVAAIYNVGTPIRLSTDSGNYDKSGDLQGWWRMGDGILDDRITDGVVVDQVNPTLGANLITNSTFTATESDTVTGWTTDGDPDTVETTGGEYHYEAWASGGNRSTFSNAMNLSAGDTFKLTFKFRKVGSETVKLKITQGASSGQGNVATVQLGTSDPALTATTMTDYLYYLTPTVGDSTGYLEFIASNDAEFYLDDVVVQKFNGNTGAMVNFDGTDFKEDTP